MQTTQRHKKGKNKRQEKGIELDIDANISQRDNLLFISGLLLLAYVFGMYVSAIFTLDYVFPYNYTWSELMISYQGGFTRRGLIGEILWQSKELCYMPNAVTVLVSLFLMVYYFVLYKKMTPIYDKYLIFFLCASPALIIFLPTNGVNAFKKDIFVLVSLLLQFHCISLYIQDKMSAYKVYICTFMLFIFGTLVHEIMIFYTLLPAMLLWQEEYKRGRGKVAFVAIGIVVASVSFFMYLHFGTRTQALIISQSWESFLYLRDGTLDSDAIAWIGKGHRHAWPTLVKAFAISNFSQTLFAFFLGSLPLMPLYSWYNVKKSIASHFTIPCYQLFLTIAFIFPLSLFLIMTDHGRVISFFAMYCLFFFITMQEINPQKRSEQCIRFLNLLMQNNALRGALLFLILLYACVWRIIPVKAQSILQFSIPVDSYLKILGLISM